MDEEHQRRTKERNKLSPPQPTILERVGTVYGHLSPATSRTRYPPSAENVRGRSDHGVTRPRARLRTRPYSGGMAQEKEKVDKEGEERTMRKLFSTHERQSAIRIMHGNPGCARH